MTTENTDDPRPDAPPPAPASPPTVQSSPERPDPAADLQRGGFLDQMLEKTKAAARGKADTLHQELAGDLEKMRHAMAHPRGSLSPYVDIPKENLPSAVVSLQNAQYRTDAVLRFCVGQRWQIEDSDGDRRSAAMKKYLGQADDYDQVLGDFIPTDFRREGRARLAELRFDDRTHGTAADDWPVYRARLQRRRGRQLLGVSTGLPSLDVALRGLRGLAFLGGGTGVGKSTLALFVTAHAVRKHPDLGVLFYSLDMPKTVLFDRMLCLEAGVEYGDLIAEASAQGLQQRLDGAEAQLRSQVLPRLRIIERLSLKEGEILFRRIAADLNQFFDSAAVSPVLVIVDYFQLLPVPDAIGAGIDADFYRVQALQQVQQWSSTNQDPAGFPVLAISEVRKGESGRTEIGVADLMGTARLGYAAEAVLLLESRGEDDGGPVAPVRLKVAKGRDGAVRTQIDLLFEHTRSNFREAPQGRSSKKGGKSRKEAPARKPDQPPIDPLAGLEG